MESQTETPEEPDGTLLDAWLRQRRISQSQIDQEEDPEKKKKLKVQQENSDDSENIIRQYVNPNGLSISKDHKITYFASLEDRKKWLEIKTILDPDTKKPTEFIGLHRGLTVNRHLDEADAFAIIALARKQGWASVKLHGKQDEKDKLWLAAQRQGMAVDMTGYIPSKDIEKRWLEEQAAKNANDALKDPAGVSPATAPATPSSSGGQPVQPAPPETSGPGNHIQRQYNGNAAGGKNHAPSRQGPQDRGPAYCRQVASRQVQESSFIVQERGTVPENHGCRAVQESRGQASSHGTALPSALKC